MSRRDARAAGQQARHASDRLQATLGGGSRGLLRDGSGEEGFEYRSPEAPAASGPRGSSAGRSDSAGAGLTLAHGAPSLRWRVGLRLALLAGILAVLMCSWFWWQAGTDRPEILPLSGATPGGGEAGPAIPAGDRAVASESAGAPGSPPVSPGGLVVVHVAGAVARPGVLRLPQGSRTDDAVAAAGGAAPDADVNRLNLALPVQDGQKIYVPRQGEAMPAPPDSSGPAAAALDGLGPPGEPSGAGGKINLNTASAAELDALPKVGPVLAQRIVDWRNEHGAFTSVEELDAVDGVGPRMLEALLPLVTV